MSSQQTIAGRERAFAARLHRNTGTATGTGGDRRSQTSHLSYAELQSLATSLGQPTFVDVVDPLDFEDLILQHQPLADEVDGPSVLTEFPDDDIEVTNIPRTHRTTVPTVPDNSHLITDPLVRDCIKSYTDDWSIVNRKYQVKAFGGKGATWKRAVRSDNFAQKLHKHEYEVDERIRIEQEEARRNAERKKSMDSPRGSWVASIVDLQSCQPDPLLEGLLDNVIQDARDTQNEIFRKRNRIPSMFSIYSMPQEDEQYVTRTPAVIPQEHVGQRILVRCTELRLDLDVEPIFATMALYDCKVKRKISENFHFDMNTDKHRKMIADFVQKPSISTLAKSCIFSISYPSSEVCLVIKLEKVLQQGDITECAEAYMKDNESQKKSLDKVSALAKQFCASNGAFRMPFAWTAIHLIDVVTGATAGETNGQPEKEQQQPSRESSTKRASPDTSTLRSSLRKGDGLNRKPSNSADIGKPNVTKSDRPRNADSDEAAVDLSTFRPISLTVSTFFKQDSEKLSDEDLFKLLADLRRPNSLLRKLKCIQGTLKLHITPPPENLKYCLTPELIPVNPYPDRQGTPIKEIQEFAPKEVYVPYTAYRNTLYVYPMFLNFSNRAGSARNIAVKVQFMSGEDEAHVLCNLYGKSYGPEFVSEIMTPITYHNKTPYFYEEIKVKLPPSLGEQHHLLFTFYHVSFKSEGTGPIESAPIGYTWIPALREGRLQLGEFCLPVAIDKLPQSYSMLSTDLQLPNMKWVDGHKGVFTCAVHTESSVHAQDIFIGRFFRCCHIVEGRVPPSSHRSTDGQNIETMLRKCVKDLEKSQEEPLVRFLYLILDKLFMLLVRTPSSSGTVVNIGQCAFETLASIVHRVHSLGEAGLDKHGRSSLLSSFVSYVFNSPGSGTPMPSPAHSPTTPRGSASSPTNLLKTSKSLSSSNPTLHEAATHSKSGSGVLGGESWMDDVLKDYSNMAGNRSSVAESSTRVVRQPSFVGSRKLAHEELALQWAVILHPFKELAMSHAWFFFDVIAKSMAQHLDVADKLFWSRKERFHERFLDDILALVHNVTTEIISKAEKSFKTSRSLNISLAFFLNDLFSLMDRGFVLTLVKHYMKEMADNLGYSDLNLCFLKMELLHIVCSHEHFVVLNLPFPSVTQSVSPSPSLNSVTSSLSSTYSIIARESPAAAELTVAFREQHYLVGLLLCEVKNAFDSNEVDCMTHAVDVLTDVMSTHDLDTRYDSRECRNRIANLYLPLIAIVQDVLAQLHGYESEKEDTISESLAMAIAMSSVTQRSNRSDDTRSIDLSSQMSTRASKISLETTRNLLMCVMWVLKNIGVEALNQWWSKFSAARLIQLLEVLDLSIKLFEYEPRKPGKSKPGKSNKAAAPAPSDNKERLKSLSDAIMNPSAAREMLRRRKEMDYGADRQDESPKLRWRKDDTYWKRSSEIGMGNMEQLLRVQVVGNLSAEVALIVLDTLELLVKSMQANDMMKIVINNCLRVLLHSLACNQSTEVLQNMFATQRSIVKKFPELIFEEETELCADLCYRLLSHCTSSSNVIRAHACASLYLLMRQNYEIGNNFARVKMQVTMALSTLVGSDQHLNEDHVRRSLKTVITYAESDQQLKSSTFPEQVRELVFNLHMILSDTVKMKEYEEDTEMYIDLMYRIAKGYQNSPDLRLTWLQNMAKEHTKWKNYSEAGMCLVHSAALVAEYLVMVEDRRYLPIGCIQFEEISGNVVEESAVSDDVVSPGDEGICTGKYFTENGLIGLLDHATQSFKEAQMFELQNQVTKLLIPIHEARRDHKKLALLHIHLGEAFNKIIQSEGKRMMGTYFRVGFFGSLFGGIDGEEFVYKEPAITKLPEVSHRLQGFYGDKFGVDRVEMIKDSNVVDPTRLDASKAYIQITYVEPYFEEYELEERITHFDQNNDLRRFIFVTPFTPSGKAHGDLASQYKRKTILTLAHAFPYVKTRINVVQREEIVLTPIEVAIEDVQSKTKELRRALGSGKPDVKMLQMVLQGCIGTTVNQGPFEIANVFLSDFEKDRNGESTITRHHHKLRLCFKEFVKICDDALSKNKTLITHEQKAYQKELERNFHTFVEKLEPLLKSKFGTQRGSLRKRDGFASFKKTPSSFSDDHSHSI